MNPLITLRDNSVISLKNTVKEMEKKDDGFRNDLDYMYDLASVNGYDSCIGMGNVTANDVLSIDYKKILSIDQLRRIKCWVESEYRLDLIDNIGRFYDEETDGWDLTALERIAGSPVYLPEDNLEKYFIIKVTDISKVTSGEIDNVAHEALIALAGTNMLREKIPNFSYIYASFILPVCPDQYSDDCTVVVQERIIGNSLRKSIAAYDFKLFLNILLQLILSVYIGQKYIDFTHYDLHTDNVIIKPLDKPITISYEEYEITTDKVAIIIDYGLSHIRVDGVDYGAGGMENFGILPDDSFWIMDICKILFFVYKDWHPLIHDNLLPNMKGTKEIFFRKNSDKIGNFFTKLGLLMKFFVGDVNSIYYFVYGYLKRFRFGQTFKTENNKYSSPLDFVEYIIQNFPEETRDIIRKT